MSRGIALRLIIDELRGIEECDDQFVLETEIQGKHGTKPPLEELSGLVFRWLHDHLADLADMVTLRQSAGVPGQQRYKLQVECAKIEGFSRHFFGVRVVAPSPFCKRTVLIRMRLADQPCQWKAALVCPNWHIAEAIMKRFCNDSFDFVMRYLDQQLETVREAAASGAPDLARARAERAKNRIRHAERCVRRLEKKRSLLRKLCHLLLQAGAKVDDRLPEKALREVLRAVFSSHHELAFEEARYIIVRAGLIRPVKNDVFVVDPLVEEYAAEYVRAEEERRYQRYLDLKRRFRSAGDQAKAEAERLLERAVAKELLAEQYYEQFALVEAAGIDGATTANAPALRMGVVNRNGKHRRR